MRKKAKLLPALAFSVAFVPMAEVAAIAVVAHHNVAMSSTASQHHSSMVAMPVVNPVVAGSGMYFMRAPMRSSPPAGTPKTA